MRLFLAAFIALFTLLLASPASAAPAEFTDPCGDAMFYAQAAGQNVTSPDSQSPAFDIKSVQLSTVRDDDGKVTGVDFSTQVCGNVTAPASNQGYSWHWTTPNGCTQNLNFSSEGSVNVPDGYSSQPYVTLAETCVADNPTTPGTEYENTYEVALDPAEVVTLEGDRVTIAVRLADLTDEARATISEGAAVQRPFASAYLTENPWSARYGDGQGTTNVGFFGGRDMADSDAHWTVGQ